jgi:hypothetical protein
MRRVLLLPVVATGLALAGCSSQFPEFAKESVEEVKIHEGGVKVSSRDPAKIESLLAALRDAQATKDHKCGDSGEVFLGKKGGEEIRLGILPGHNDQYYEFRLYRGRGYAIYRVQREGFLKAMAALGVKNLDPGGPE